MVPRSSLLAALLTATHAGVGPSVLYNRLFGTTINAAGYTFQGAYTSYVVRPYVNGYQSGTISVGTFNTYVSRCISHLSADLGTLLRGIFFLALPPSSTFSGGQYTYASYRNGDGPCPNGAYRQLQLYTACGSTFTVVSLSEPVMCTYVLSLLLPEACGVDFTVGLEAASASPTVSLTASQTSSKSQSLTRSGSRTGSGTSSALATSSQTQTLSRTPSQTQSGSPTSSPSATVTPSKTASSTLTASSSPTRSMTQTKSSSGSPSATATPTLTQSPSGSVTSSHTRTPSASPTMSLTPSPTQSRSMTSTRSQTQSPTPTSTPTSTITRTLTPSPTSSPTQSQTPSVSSTPSLSMSPTQTQTGSVTATASQSRSETSSQTQSPTQSSSQGPTPSPTTSQSRTQSSTPTQSTTPVGGVCFDDGTLGLTAALDPGVIASLYPPSTTTYAVSFRVLASDPTCGPGRYSLTQLLVGASQMPGEAAVTNAVVVLYKANPITGVPESAIAARAVIAVPLPPAGAPAYIALYLSALMINVPTHGVSYAIAISFDRPVFLYAPASASPSTSVLAESYAALQSTDGGVTWAQTPGSAAALLLHCPVIACAASTSQSGTPSLTSSGTRSSSGMRTPTSTPTPSLTGTRSSSRSQSASGTRTRSQSGTRTRSRSPTGTRSATGSASGSASQSNSASVTPSASMSPSGSPSPTGTPSGSASATGTPSQSLSQTQSPSVTGFPVQLVLDSTDGLSVPIDPNVSAFGARLVTPDISWAVAFAFPESDPSCGPGAYRLEGVNLPLACIDTSLSSPLLLVVQLWSLDVLSGVPAVPLQTAVLPAPPALVPGAAPAFFSIALPASFVVNASVLNQAAAAISVFASASVSWLAVVPAQSPVPGSGVPRGAFESIDYGVTWSPASAFGALQIVASKLYCAPSSTGSVTMSASGTRSQAHSSTAGLNELSDSLTPTQTRVPSASRTAASTGSERPSPIPSLSQRSSRSPSITSTATAARTVTGTSTASSSSSDSASQSGSVSPSSSETGTSSQSSSASEIVAGSASATGTSSPSSAESPSPTSTRSSTGSAGPSPIPSRSGSNGASSFPSPSRSRSRGMSPSTSLSPSSSQGASLSPSSRSGSRGSSPSLTVTPSQNQSKSSRDVATPSSLSGATSSAQTVSASNSPTLSQSVSPSASSSASLSAQVSASMSPSVTPHSPLSTVVRSVLPETSTLQIVASQTRTAMTTASVAGSPSQTRSPSKCPSPRSLSASPSANATSFSNVGGAESGAGGAGGGMLPSTVGAVVATSLLLLLLLLCLLCFLLLRRKRRRRAEGKATPHPTCEERSGGMSIQLPARINPGRAMVGQVPEPGSASLALQLNPALAIDRYGLQEAAEVQGSDAPEGDSSDGMEAMLDVPQAVAGSLHAAHDEPLTTAGVPAQASCGVDGTRGESLLLAGAIPRAEAGGGSDVTTAKPVIRSGNWPRRWAAGPLVPVTAPGPVQPTLPLTVAVTATTGCDVKPRRGPVLTVAIASAVASAYKQAPSAPADPAVTEASSYDRSSCDAASSRSSHSNHSLDMTREPPLPSVSSVDPDASCPETSPRVNEQPQQQIAYLTSVWGRMGGAPPVLHRSHSGFVLSPVTSPQSHRQPPPWATRPSALSLLRRPAGGSTSTLAAPQMLRLSPGGASSRPPEMLQGSLPAQGSDVAVTAAIAADSVVLPPALSPARGSVSSPRLARPALPLSCMMDIVGVLPDGASAEFFDGSSSRRTRLSQPSATGSATGSSLPGCLDGDAAGTDPSDTLRCSHEAELLLNSHMARHHSSPPPNQTATHLVPQGRVGAGANATPRIMLLSPGVGVGGPRNPRLPAIRRVALPSNSPRTGIGSALSVSDGPTPQLRVI